jgi:formamidopyrimidine-DNA glycosylase
LRWKVPTDLLQQQLPGSSFKNIQRRGKYLLLDTGHGHVIIHLGMSGSLRVIDANTPLEKHDHVEIRFTSEQSLRLRDPRRFGAVLWTADDPDQHALLASLGPEPLSDDFTAEHLFKATRKRRVAIKNLIMDASQVVGVGNIYACESLFRAGIRPGKAAGRLSRKECTSLVDEIKRVLSDAIKAGGTTLRDFSGTDGQPGYFSQSLFVYGRESEPCLQCGIAIKRRIIGQRSTFYCTVCQQ